MQAAKEGGRDLLGEMAPDLKGRVRAAQGSFAKYRVTVVER
jgi:hypothetical protein